ncbi:MAG TPA: hypothetical protein VIL18_11310 [Longimicrobiales bacterium]
MRTRVGEGRFIAREPPFGWGRLFVAVFGGPIAWSLHLLVSYFLVALFCNTGWPGLGIALAGATVLAAAAAAGSGLVAWRAWREHVDGQPWDAALSDPRGWATGFLLVIGMVAAGLFLLIILLAGLPPIFLSECSAGEPLAVGGAP